MSITTEAPGIFAADIIIRSGVQQALNDLRANPYLLDYVFASLPADSLTTKEYGQLSSDAAKKWFLSTNIPVVMAHRPERGEMPCISIHLGSSTEAEQTLGDVHYESKEVLADEWPILAGPYVPAYNTQTGKMTIKGLSIVPAVGMSVISASGRACLITETFSDRSFKIASGTNSDFSSVTIKGRKPAVVQNLESIFMRETYSIGIHSSGDPAYMMWLHSIMVFALNRGKQAYFEARGFERSTMNSSDFNFEPINGGEIAYTRYLTLSGFVKNYWPKEKRNTIQSITGFGGTAGSLVISQAVELPADVDYKTAPWIGPLDALKFDE